VARSSQEGQVRPRHADSATTFGLCLHDTADVQRHAADVVEAALAEPDEPIA
jgi:hypothetical protein